MEKTIIEYEALKCEELLKYDYPKDILWLSECTTTEDFRRFYGNYSYFDFGLDKYKYVVYWHESGSIQQIGGFNNEKEFANACRFVATGIMI